VVEHLDRPVLHRIRTQHGLAVYKGVLNLRRQDFLTVGYGYLRLKGQINSSPILVESLPPVNTLVVTRT